MLGVLSVLSCGGCNTAADRAVVNPGPTESGQQARAYPHHLDPGPVHNIQVFRDVTRLRLTNTTATAFPEGTLWINRRYALDVPAFPPGETLELDLTTFVDEYATPFKAGGFFATRTPDPVVVCELQTGDLIHPFVIVHDNPE
ncbi:MAG: hypothetical protein ACF8Q5_08670 [Phycisphaerales bacterium JB040]